MFEKCQKDLEVKNKHIDETKTKAEKILSKRLHSHRMSIKEQEEKFEK